MKKQKKVVLQTSNLTYSLQALEDFNTVLSDNIASYWPWHKDINWFLAIAEFKRLTNQPLKQCFLLEVLAEKTCLLALPLCSSNDGRYWGSLTDVYSPSFNFISPATTLIKNPWQCLFDALSLLEPDWASFQLAPLKQEQIQQLIQVQGLLRAHVFQHSANWIANFNSTDDYWSKRPSKLKNTIKRKKVKLLSNGGRVEIHRSLTEEIMLSYWQVYQKSWKQPETDRYFINWLANYCSANGMLRLGFLFVDHKPVACQLWLVNKSKAAIYKLAQDSTFDNLSPGTVLMAEMINHVIERDSVKEIDFLTGNDAYKALWMDKAAPLFGVHIYNTSSLIGKTLWCWQSFKTTVKALYSKINHVVRGIDDNKS